MNKWICPHCGKAMYSSWEQPKDKLVECIYCGRMIPNPYYRGEARQEFPIEIKINGQTYRVLGFVEVGGMSMTGNGQPEINYSCRAQWLSPYGWKKLRNANILGELRKICEAMQ